MQLEDQLNDSQSNLSYLKSNLQHMEEQTTAEKKETLKCVCTLFSFLTLYFFLVSNTAYYYVACTSNG